MDRKVLIKNLSNLFCDVNKAGTRYSEVWLSDVDFGGLYQSDKLILNVKAEHQIDNCNDEIRGILKLLDEKAHQELQFIWSVQVYDVDDKIHCVEDGILIYDEDNACK